MNNLKGIKVLYGGSFNPPTKAHYNIAKMIIERFDVSSFVFLPTADNYQKSDLAPITNRIEMLEIMCKKLTNATVSKYEGNLSKYEGTHLTLKHFPGYYFLMGADNLININKWLNYPNVIIENKFLVINRNKIDITKIMEKDYYLKKYQNNFIVINDFDEINMSSSEYRKSKTAELLLDEIRDYININNLYRLP